ncbi:MAG: phage terminase small subunit P27 family [Planctomycetes bacterium]|nr:phage terminase small subunit P27 family [Planctomycetota bacterium]
MKRGPKPVPTVLKLARGSRRIAGRIEPQPEPSPPTCPIHLTEAAKHEWRTIAPKLMRLGLLTELDRAALAAYCQAWGDWIEARRAIKLSGTVVKAPDGGLMLNPYLKVATIAAKQMHEFLVEFGLTPSSRTRVVVVPRTDPDDPKLRFFRPRA